MFSIGLLETDLGCLFSEAPSAEVEAVLSDETLPGGAASAGT